MEMLLSKDIQDFSEDEINSLNLSEYSKIEHSNGYAANSMFIAPSKPQLIESPTFFPVMIHANKHKEHVIDTSKPYKTQADCQAYCTAMNDKLAHTKKSMFMILESIRIEELLRKKLRLTNELKVTSDFTIRESAGYKFILYDKGNGIIETSSINDALNNGLAALKREKDMKAVKEQTQEVKRSNTRHDYKW